VTYFKGMIPALLTPFEFDVAMMAHPNVSRLRYTSSMGADRFVDESVSIQFFDALSERQAADVIVPLSSCVNVPFCDTVFDDCACHKTVTKQKDGNHAHSYDLPVKIDSVRVAGNVT